MIGFTFRNIHSSVYNIGVKSDDRSLLPELRKNEFFIPGRHGTVDFGLNTYEKRIISVEIGLLKNADWATLRASARDVADWLSGKGRLVFDDEPTRAYNASVYDPIGITQIQALPSGIISVSFECQPFAEDINYNQSLTTLSASPQDIAITSAGTQETPCLIYITNKGLTDIVGVKILRKGEI